MNRFDERQPLEERRQLVWSLDEEFSATPRRRRGPSSGSPQADDLQLTQRALIVMSNLFEAPLNWRRSLINSYTRFRDSSQSTSSRSRTNSKLSRENRKRHADHRNVEARCSIAQNHPLTYHHNEDRSLKIEQHPGDNNDDGAQSFCSLFTKRKRRQSRTQERVHPSPKEKQTRFAGPILLAACFSLLLLMSLVILFGLSFHTHHQQQQHQLELQRLEQLQQQHPTSLATISGSQPSMDGPQDWDAQSESPRTRFIMDDSIDRRDELSRGLQMSTINGIDSENSRQHSKGRNASDKVQMQSQSQIQITITHDDRARQKDRGKKKRLLFEKMLTVKTECGSYVGQLEPSGGLSFLAIPYATAPVGKRRWSRSEPIWQDSNDSGDSNSGRCRPNETYYLSRTHSRPVCAQLSPITARFTGQEDCLYLDIYTPMLSEAPMTKKLPVMVYIHGGFLTYGSSWGSQENGDMGSRPSGKLAAELDVVIVAFNYRLQALGFLTLLALAQNKGPQGSAGNYGLWDQVAALQWVRRNIEPFGGQPDNVILFGPDSASALALSQVAAAAAPARSAKLDPPPQQNDSNLENNNAANGNRNTNNDDHDDNKSSAALDSNLAEQAGDCLMEPLFRAVWLTNPTLYYDKSSQLANQHYERLFSSLAAETGGASRPETEDAADAGAAFSSSLPVCLREVFKQKQHNSDSDSMVTTTNYTSDASNHNNENLVECLLSLSAQQASRIFLANDDPSYRLDDQNSLPIHGIYADQLVNIDGELVQGAFPFIKPDRSCDKNNKYKSSNKNISVNMKRPKIDFLIGSSSQAAEYWPCPRNLQHWNWTDFVRYSSTSLNSFRPGTYQEAMRLYESSLSDKNASEIYLTMVSDIRQICPINELTRQLRQLEYPVQRYIVDYWPQSPKRETVNTNNNTKNATAINQAASGRATTTTDEPIKSQEHQFAYHKLDLEAFFGFQAREGAISRENALFSERIREMVREFVHRNSENSRSTMKPNHDDNQEKDSGDEFVFRNGAQQNQGYWIFGRQGELKHETGDDATMDYKDAQCQFWHHHLGDSYAWIS